MQNRVLSGPVIQENQRNPSCTTTHVLRIDAEPVINIQLTVRMYNQLEKLWDLEKLRIRDNELTTESKFMEEINFNGKQYEIRLPFREEHPQLPDNHTGSVKRFSSLIPRLKANPKLLQE